jgi:hypothetical protein
LLLSPAIFCGIMVGFQFVVNDALRTSELFKVCIVVLFGSFVFSTSINIKHDEGKLSNVSLLESARKIRKAMNYQLGSFALVLTNHQQ